MARRRLRREEYTVGWICALPIELAAAQEMLDAEHEDLEQDEHDNNLYSLGRIREHNVVIVCLPGGLTTEQQPCSSDCDADAGNV